MEKCKEKIRINFSKNAETYDQYSEIQVLCAEKLVKLLNGKYREILDVGCGTGGYTKLLLSRFPDARVTGIDISRSMISEARKKFPKETRLDLCTIDAEKLDMNKKFDLITSNASFQWFSDLELFFTKASKMLYPGGELCFSIYGPGTFKELQLVLEILFGEKHLLSSSQFYGKKTLDACLSAVFAEFCGEQSDFKMKFDSLHDFLLNIKKCGARGSGLNKDFFMGKQRFSSLEKKYLDMFNEIIATHQVFFYKAVKTVDSSQSTVSSR